MAVGVRERGLFCGKACDQCINPFACFRYNGFSTEKGLGPSSRPLRSATACAPTSAAAERSSAPSRSLLRENMPPSRPRPRNRAVSIAATHGSRIAGALLVINAALCMTRAFTGHTLGPVNRGAAVIDLILGVSLLSGRGWRTLTILRCLLGAIILTGLEFSDGGLQVFDGDWLGAGAQVGLSAGLLSLLLGDPGALRLVASTLVAVPYLALTLVWLVVSR